MLIKFFLIILWIKYIKIRIFFIVFKRTSLSKKKKYIEI